MPSSDYHGVGESLHWESILPSNAAAGTVTGAAIDRTGYGSCLLMASCGAASGTPDSFTVATKITHCATSAGSYTDLAGANVTTQTTASTTARKSVDLSGALKFIKIVQVVAFVNGTSPKIPASAEVIFGGAVTAPQS